MSVKVACWRIDRLRSSSSSNLTVTRVDFEVGFIVDMIILKLKDTSIMEQEQMNTPNSLKEEIRELLKKFIDLVMGYYRNEPIKFWTNLILLVLSILTIIIVEINKCLVPFIFNDSLTFIINVYVYFASILYVPGLFLYLIFKVLNSKQGLKWTILIVAAIFLPMFVALNIIPIYRLLQLQILPEETIPLSEFGAFFGAIVSLFAFYGVLTNLMQSERRADKAETISRDRYREDSERTIFFQLLELHTKKVDSVIYNYSHNQEDKTSNQEYKASQAFGQFTVQADVYLNAYITYNNIKKIEESEINSEMRRLFLSLYLFQQKKSIIEQIPNKFIPDGIKLISEVKNSLQLENIQAYFSDNCGDISCVIYSLEKKDFKFIYSSIKNVADLIYKDYGHILGHYFRNMYYVMDTINNFSDKKNYKELFRAQLSRYELSLGFFNAVSSRSSLKMVKLLEEFDIFKDLYEEDLIMFKLAKEKGVEPSKLIKNILNEYKKDVSNKSDK